MDTQQRIITQIHSSLAGDTDLQTIFGGTVRVFPVWAPPDAEFPYIVHRAEMIRVEDFFPMRSGTLIVDAWSYSPNVEEVTNIRERVIAALDELDFSATEISHCRVFLESDGFVPETEADVWHYTCQFNIRLYRKAEVASILAR